MIPGRSPDWTAFVTRVMDAWDRGLDTKDMVTELMAPEHVCAMALCVGRDERFRQRAVA